MPCTRHHVIYIFHTYTCDLVYRVVCFPQMRYSKEYTMCISVRENEHMSLHGQINYLEQIHSRIDNLIVGWFSLAGLQELHTKYSWWRPTRPNVLQSSHWFCYIYLLRINSSLSNNIEMSLYNIVTPSKHNQLSVTAMQTHVVHALPSQNTSYPGRHVS